MQSIKVADYLNRRPVTFLANMTIEAVVERLLQSAQAGGPVIDVDGRVVGFISEQDCLQKMLESTYQNEAHSVVRDVMNPDPVCVFDDESVLALAERMTVNKPKLYPVCNRDGKLVGIIGRTEVLAALDLHFHGNYLPGRRFV